MKNNKIETMLSKMFKFQNAYANLLQWIHELNICQLTSCLILKGDIHKRTYFAF